MTAPFIAHVARRPHAFLNPATFPGNLLTDPGAHIVSFDDAALPSISLSDTQHCQITNGILRNPEAYWKHLRDPQ